MNVVHILGNLGQDPEVRYTQAGNAVTNLSIATSRKWKDKNTGEMQEQTEWHRVVAFSRQAEVLGEYLKKGSKVQITGRLQTRKWEDNNGNDRYTTEIVCEGFEFVGGQDGAPKASNAGGGFRDKAPEPKDDFKDDDIPF